MLFISPPFGNYISLPYSYQIKGSFTLEERSGLIKQIINTLRYDFNNNGWVNKIGLRNKGLEYGIKNYRKNDIISIAILNKDEIPKINQMIPDDMNIELNISCPNAEKNMINKNLEVFLNKKREFCIIKLSPLTDKRLIDDYYNKGFRQFHCSNTIPTKNGGLSGISLIPNNNNLIKYLQKYKDIYIIAGGGIRYYEDIINYQKNGANGFSLSTIWFNPILAVNLYFNYLYYYK